MAYDIAQFKRDVDELWPLARADWRANNLWPGLRLWSGVSQVHEAFILPGEDFLPSAEIALQIIRERKPVALAFCLDAWSSANRDIRPSKDPARMDTLMFLAIGPDFRFRRFCVNEGGKCEDEEDVPVFPGFEYAARFLMDQVAEECLRPWGATHAVEVYLGSRWHQIGTCTTGNVDKLIGQLLDNERGALGLGRPRTAGENEFKPRRARQLQPGFRLIPLLMGVEVGN